MTTEQALAQFAVWCVRLEGEWVSVAEIQNQLKAYGLTDHVGNWFATDAVCKLAEGE